MSNKYEFPITGPYEDLPKGTALWSLSVSSRLQSAVDKAEEWGIDRLLEELVEVVKGEPWMNFPEDKPVFTAEAYFPLVTGHKWESLKKLIIEFRPNADIEFIEESFSNENRDKYIRENPDNLTQKKLGERVGLSQGRVAQILLEKDGMPDKTNNTKRTRQTYQIQSGTKPETAAQKIREKFGEEFAQQLKELL